MSFSKLSNQLFLSNAARFKSTAQLFKSILLQHQPKPLIFIPKCSIKTTQTQLQNRTTSNRLIDKRTKNLVSRENYFSSEINKAKETIANNTQAAEASSLSIFKRFKDAYKQHGKVLVGVHILASFGWIFSFFALAKR